MTAGDWWPTGETVSPEKGVRIHLARVIYGRGGEIPTAERPRVRLMSSNRSHCCTWIWAPLKNNGHRKACQQPFFCQFESVIHCVKSDSLRMFEVSVITVVKCRRRNYGKIQIFGLNGIHCQSRMFWLGHFQIFEQRKWQNFVKYLLEYGE